jgi:sugar lactone lactonase YvrE
LVTPGSPSEAEQRQAQQEAMLSSSQAVVTREESQTKYENLDAAQAAKLAGEAFPSVIGEAAGGPPMLPAGESITAFPTDYAAQVKLGGGASGLIESLAPMAIETPGDRVPVDLGLREAGVAFEPDNPLVAVRIPKRLGEGTQLPAVGVSVTPVGAEGTSLGGSEGTVDEATVFFANTLTNVDTAIKPTNAGFAVETILRSPESPQQLSFRVGLPEGASLVQAKNGSGGAEVLKEGVAIAVVPAPTSRDAAGRFVPVSMLASGNTLTLTVEHGSGELTYPLLVDPEFNELTETTVSTRTWEFASATGGFAEEVVSNGLLIKHSGGYAYGQRAELYYRTNGESKIYQLNTKTEYGPTVGYGGGDFELNADAEDYLEYEGTGGRENRLTISGPQTEGLGFKSQLCASTCLPESGGEHNLARLATVVTGSLNAELLELRLMEASVAISQPKELHSTTEFNAKSPEIDGQPNVIYTGGWISSHQGAVEVKAEDPGLGVAATRFEWYEKGEWHGGGEGWPDSKNYLGTSSCAGVQCAKAQSEGLDYANLAYDEGAFESRLPEGEQKVRFAADDAMEHTWSSEHGEGEATIKVDNKPPHNITVTGLPETGEELALGETTGTIKVSATDGEEPIHGEEALPTSGIKSIEVYVDGRETGSAAGWCVRGPCTTSGEWSLNGAEIGYGAHALTIKATDNAGNVATKEYTLNVYEASPVAMGPGSVNPESGDFALGATDVSLSGGAGSLAVTRHYDSRNPKEGEEGPVGPQWSLSLGELASLEVLPDGSVMVVGPEGLTHFSVKKGGGLEAPWGDSNLTLELKGSEYLLKDSAKGTTTKFTLPTGAKSWMPTVSEGPVATDTMTDEYTTVEPEAGKTIVEPTLELAPHPAAACGHEELEKLALTARGCRALKFVYATRTKENIGENQGEWGEYKSRLVEVIAIAYSPATKTMAKVPVAEYEYDKQGRLRAEWDPGVSPALKVTYGYDAEGHVTALTAPGQQPWLFTYGMTSTESSPGRLLATTRPSAATSLGGGAAPVNTTAPALSSTSPVEGTTLSVSSGTWSNSPLSSAYQWERCYPSEGKEACRPIAGATNGTYTPTNKDSGYELQVRITATNGGGSNVAVSNLSKKAVITAGVYERTGEFGKEGSAEGQLKKPAGIAVDSEGNIWVVDTGNDRIEKFSSSGTFLKAYGKEGTGHLQFKEPKSIAIDQEGYIFVADAGNSRIEELSHSGEYVEQLALSSAPGGLAIGRRTLGTVRYDALYVTMPSANKIVEYLQPIPRHEEFGEYDVFGKAGTGNGQFEEPTSIALNRAGRSELEVAAKGLAYVTDTGNHRVQILKFVNEAGTMAYSSQFGKSGSEPGQFSFPRAIADVPNGNYGLSNDVLIADPGDGRFQQFGESGAYQEQYPEKEAESIAVAAVSGVAYVANTGKSEISEWAPGPLPLKVPEPPSPGTSSITTIDYNVPISGSSAPYGMGKSEVSTWGEKDDPTQATAIFPPSEPMGWPAKDYKQATIYYMDSEARTVNVASSSSATAGAISTKEYNAEGQVARSLSVDNRATALVEGCESEKSCKSAEAAKLLSTESAYNGEGELTDTWGPQHLVKLVAGKEGKSEEVLARNHVKYHYDEGAPSGEKYALVTKTEDGAETAAKEEFDVRTTTTGYSGQSNLGWELREPTSTTVDPGGLNLTSTIKYEKATGNVIETQGPAAAGGDTKVPPAYSIAFGSAGAAGGQLSGPEHAAVDSHGDLWVTDFGNNRIEEFSAAGKFMLAVGWGVKDGKAEAETCTSECKAGISGSGKAQFNGPVGIAINQTNNDIYVSDLTNNRIEELSSAGAWLATFGAKGTTGGDFSSPEGVTLDSSGDLWVADAANSRIQELSSSGVFMLAVGWGVKDGKSEAETCTSASECKAGISGSGNGQLAGPNALAFSGGNFYVADYANDRVDEFTTAGAYVTKFGSKGTSTGEFEGPHDIVTEAATGDLYVIDKNNNRVQKFTVAGGFLSTFGTNGAGNGQLEVPQGMTITSAGDLYVLDSVADRIEEWVPTITGNEGAHSTKTVYYTAKGEAEVAECREQIEWVGLPCETMPAAQPAVSGLPERPVTKVSYNMWDQPEKIEETFGSGAEAKTRTKKTTYEESSGRPLTSEVTASIDKTVPKITDKYNETSGALETQSSSMEGKTLGTITSKYNTIGQLETYTDAAGNTATFEYEKEKDARLVKVSDAKGNQTYHYNETTGALIELDDSGAGAFKAEYDLAGKMTSESYPNGMTAYYTHNPAGEAIGIEYKKLTHCTEKCVWFSDTTVPSIHGETLKQKSTLSEEPSYTYDAAGRLTQTQEIPTGEGCKTRIYSYDEDSNRTTETTREPGSEGKCASEGGSTEWHTYDTADSLADPGITYETFGDVTQLPAADAGGSTLTSEYYADGQVAKQEQNKQKLEYKLDPEQRTLETIATGTLASTVISHYDAAGAAVAWTSEGSGETEKWTRNVPGIDGSLTATQKGEGKTGGAVVLLLHDISGDVVGEAAISETETKLLKSFNSTEFGVPNGKEAPPKYAWLGATGVASELPSGVITQDGITYVPQTGLPLQSEGVALPALQNAAAAFSRPVEAWVGSKAGEGAAIGLANAKQKQEEREAANQPPGAIPTGGLGGGEGEEEEGGGGCPGVNACAASVHEGVTHYHEEGNNGYGCAIWGSWGSGEVLAGDIVGFGHWKCAGPVPGFEMQIEAFGWGAKEFEGYEVQLGTPSHKNKEHWAGESGNVFSQTWKCPATGSYYHLWFWGRQWGTHGRTQWVASGKEARVGSCTKEGPVDFTPIGQGAEES